LADHIRAEMGSEPREQVRRVLHRVTSRPPSDREISQGVALLQSLTSEEGLGATAALDAFCLLAFNLNEFLYLE
jgi:hypothetical protein